MNYFLAMTIPQSICNLCNIFCSPEIHKAILNEMPFSICTYLPNHHKNKTSLVRTWHVRAHTRALMHAHTHVIPPNTAIISYWTFLSFIYLHYIAGCLLCCLGFFLWQSVWYWESLFSK
jgi:hypothetical protein